MSEDPDREALSAMPRLRPSDYGTFHPRRAAPQPPNHPPPPYTPHLPAQNPNQVRLRIIFTASVIQPLNLHVNQNITVRDMQERVRDARPHAPSPSQSRIVYRGQPILDPSLTLRRVLHHDGGNSVHVMQVHALPVGGGAAVNERNADRSGRTPGIERHSGLHHHTNVSSAGMFRLGACFGWIRMLLAGLVLRGFRST